MQIIITPSDLIIRCIFDKYKKFCIYDKTEEDIKQFVEENNPLSLSEQDAYAIGLLKIIETDNLIHRFNENILDILQIKSNIIQDELFINKNIILKEIETYMLKFPTYFKAPFNYKVALEDLIKYISEMNKKIEKLEVITVKQKEKVFNYYKSLDIKKCLNI